MNILEEIASKRIEDVNKQKKIILLENVIEQAEEIAREEYKKNGKYLFPFKAAISKPGINFICEVKKASPSKGIIAEDFPYVHIAKEYEAAGAAAISVLTEPHYFQGSDSYLKEITDTVSIPAIRKDFIVDEYQIYEAKILGASAILLICSLLDDDRLKHYLDIAHSLGLSALVETHDEEEVNSAIKIGATIIGVNNRDLKTFNVDIKNSVRLRKMVPKDIVFVSESGIKTSEDIEVLRKNGTNAVLIGETLMKCEDKRSMLIKLSGEEIFAQESNPQKNTPKIKICGLKRKKDIEIVNKYRPDYIGFVFANSKRKVTKEQAIELRTMLNSDIWVVGVFVNEDIDKIVDLVEDKVIDLIQLHGDEDKEYIIKLRDALSTKQIDAKIIKAIRVKSGDNVKEIFMRNDLLIDDLLDENVQKNEKHNLSDKKRCFKNNYKLITQIDYILFDTYSSKEYGGTGQAFDWNILKDIKQPFFLAGGLNDENVNTAIEICKPYVVDVSSAVETDGYKDEEKIREFINKIRE